MMFASDQRKSVAEKTPPVELFETIDAREVDEAKNDQGFSFFKKELGAGSEVAGEDVALKAIEQEMLAVRQLYNNGHLIKDVYVSETRRLYQKARTLKTSQTG